jgi:hypothetical protein
MTCPKLGRELGDLHRGVDRLGRVFVDELATRIPRR